jgi:hypothetical protein
MCEDADPVEWATENQYSKNCREGYGSIAWDQLSST